MEKSLKSNGKTFGIYLGSTLVILSLIAYFFDLDLFVNFWFGISIYFSAIVFGTIAIIKAKVDASGVLSFKNAFSVYFLTILIGLSISSLISYIVFNFIDTYSADILKEKSIEKLVEVLNTINKSEAEITSIINKTRSENLYSFTNVFKGLIFNHLIPLSIIGLLVSAALKKNNSDTE